LIDIFTIILCNYQKIFITNTCNFYVFTGKRAGLNMFVNLKAQNNLVSFYL